MASYIANPNGGPMKNLLIILILILPTLGQAQVGKNTWYQIEEAKCVGGTNHSNFPDVEMKFLKSEGRRDFYGAEMPGGGFVEFSTRNVSFSHSQSSLKVTYNGFTSIEDGGLRLGESHWVTQSGTTYGDEMEFFCYVKIDIGYDF